MVATRSRWLLVMEKPSPTLSRVMVAVVSNFCAVMPAPPSGAESAIVKQPACAAARSSSGLVPMPLSKREWKEYGVCLRTLLSVERVPLPAFRSPCQTADALRCMIFSLQKITFECFQSNEFDSERGFEGIFAQKRKGKSNVQSEGDEAGGRGRPLDHDRRHFGAVDGTI